MTEYLTKHLVRPGVKLHGFRSGGGLRALRLEEEGRLIAYGEGPTFEGALAILEEEAEVGPRPYGEVYGEIHPLYYTGQSTPSSEQDLILLQGGNVDAEASAEGVRVVFSISKERTYPPDLGARARNGEVLQVTIDRVLCEFGPITFANGTQGYCVKPLGKPPSDWYFIETEHVGVGPDFATALKMTGLGAIK